MRNICYCYMKIAFRCVIRRHIKRGVTYSSFLLPVSCVQINRTEAVLVCAGALGICLPILLSTLYYAEIDVCGKTLRNTAREWSNRAAAPHCSGEKACETN